MKKTFAGLILAFLGTTVIGYYFSLSRPDQSMELVKKIAESIGPIKDSSFDNFVKIFTNNSKVALLMLVTGLFFGIGPWVIMGFNGFVVGLVVGISLKTGLVTWEDVVLGLIPHGIFEIPAIALAGVSGIAWYQELVKGNGTAKERFKNGLTKAMRLFLVSISLLLIAALMEAYVTPQLLAS